MENRLIMLPQPILVSDETATDGDLVVYSSYTPMQLRNNNLYSLADDWLCLPNQNSEFQPYKKIIAGLPDLPKLDLSLIAEEIGWVDVEKLAEEIIKEKALFSRSSQFSSVDARLHNARVAAFIEGYKTNQSLNERRYSERDLINAFYAGQQTHLFEAADYLKTLKPKEYLVEIIQEGNTIKVTKIIK